MITLGVTIKATWKIAATAAAFTALFFITRSIHHGFTESNLYRLPLGAQINSTPPPPELFDQAYHYLGCGAQQYALCSSDQSTVIKFFRKDRTTHPLQFLRPLLPKSLSAKLNSTLGKRMAHFKETVKSCAIAQDHLKEQTGLIAVHFTTHPQKTPTLTYTDAIGVLHHLRLDSVPFIVQKRASPFYSTLKGWIENQDLQSAREGLEKLVSLLETRCLLGIADKDPNLETNFGWIESHPIQIDIGRFRYDPIRKDPKFYRLELIRQTDPLCSWLDKSSPELAMWLRAKVKSC